MRKASADQKKSCNKPQYYERRCPYCGYSGQLVWVHGHGQCAHCKTNIDECCRGES